MSVVSGGNAVDVHIKPNQMESDTLPTRSGLRMNIQGNKKDSESLKWKWQAVQQRRRCDCGRRVVEGIPRGAEMRMDVV